MAKKSISLKLGGQNYKLRLTMHGMRELRRKYPDEEPMSTLMSSITDPDRLCDVLDECLNWGDEAQNPITDGEEFYDLLVDCGHGGQEGIADLMYDLCVYSGLVTAENAAKLRASTRRVIQNTYDNLDAQMAPEEEPELAQPNPTNEG